MREASAPALLTDAKVAVSASVVPEEIATQSNSTINAAESTTLKITGYKSLLDSLPLTETIIFLASFLLLGASAAMLLKKD